MASNDEERIQINLTGEELEQNLQDQRDEILALESIFADTEKVRILHEPRTSAEETDENSSEDQADDVYNILLTVEIALDDGISVEAWRPYSEEADKDVEVAACATPSNKPPKFHRSLSGKRLYSNFRVSHLTPLSLELVLPQSYPSRTAPSFTLSCLWLDVDHLTLLCQELDRLWLEMEAMPVMYTWMDWLQNNTLSTLSLQTTVYLIPHVFDESSSASRDYRALPECDTMEKGLVALLRHDYDEKQKQFYRSNQTCGVCFDEKLGNQFFRLSECEHHFCVDCMASYCEFHVKEGSVQRLTCPTPKCSTDLPPGVLQTVLGEEEFHRWERLILQKGLDTMGDVEWCPRCNSPVIREEEEGLQLAHCTACVYSFCTRCKDKWHGGTACLLLDDDDDEEDGKAKASKNKKSQGSSKTQNRWNKMSYRWVSQFTITCPRCRAPIEKDGGCNKVVCMVCSASLCWLCGRIIVGYEHFGKCSLWTSTYTPPGAMAIRNRPEAEGARKVREHLVENPGNRQDRLCPCPACRQRNLKENRNNHIRCFSCKANYCFQCRTVIKQPIMTHYTFGSPCVQHSD